MAETSAAPLGIFGGTFDPVHCGHLKLAEDACKKLGLARVLWVPSGNPPHREQPRTAAEHRLAMVALAIRGNPQFTLDDFETRRSEPSYMLVTLQHLRARHGDLRPLVLLLGADAFLGLLAWHRWRELFALTHIAVATRPGYALRPEEMAPELRREYEQRLDPRQTALAAQAAGTIVPFAITALEISASEARRRLVAGENAANLLPGAVLDYIAANHLYSKH